MSFGAQEKPSTSSSDILGINGDFTCLSERSPNETQPNNEAPKECPECRFTGPFYRDGLRYLSDGTQVQRWLCKKCGYRFTKKALQKLTQSLNTSNDHNFSRQVCVALARGTKNLTTAAEIKTVAGESPQADAKGKIVEFSFWMLKQAYAQATIKTRTKLIKRFIKLGADISNPESVKEVIAKQQWSSVRKCIAVDTYTCFLSMQGLKWQPPIYKRIRKLPFIPTENEIDQMISGCNKRMATFLQLLKETGVRCGEACNLQWKDIDAINSYIIVTPEKGSNSRQLKISNKLVAMLNELPKKSTKVFTANSDALRKSFEKQRKSIAYKMQNPRLRQISFHTFRHWKATMEYHKTKDILHVMQMLGHRSINNTLVYTRLMGLKDDEYIARIAHTEQEVCQLIESGFEFVCNHNGNQVFRKPK
jgi:integrase